MFLVIVIGLILAGAAWWRWIDGYLRPLRWAALWRSMFGVFAAGMVLFPIFATRVGHIFPPALPAAGFLWHVLILPPLIVATLLIEVFLWIRRRVRREPAPTDLSRRGFLMVAAAGPPLAAIGLTGVAMSQTGQFRVREVRVPLAGWPADLNEFTIAMVADVHTGPFSTPQMLADIVERTNTINDGAPADLVVLGGDLINTTLDDLPAALDMATSLRGRLGTIAVLGNHDVMDDWRLFAEAMERAAIPLLRDETLTLEPIAGIKVDFLGVRWRMTDPTLFESVAYVAKNRDRSHFPICIAHHPHAWDEAVRQGLPLVLSGHTHGGQIMLTDKIGAGPLKFRYWTGVHHRNGSTLVISNGVGNWFPLRVNAPAELLKITIVQAPTSA